MMRLTIDIYARLFCGFLLILSALIQSMWMMALFQLLLAVLLLRYLDGNWKNIMRSWKLLRWFVFPIFILHLFFTPGLAIVPGAYISVEGLERGSWLALRLGVIFISAIVMMNMLTQKEWFCLLSRIPFLGSYMTPYLLLISPLYDESQRAVKASWKHWHQSKHKRKIFSEMVVNMTQGLIFKSHTVAQLVWQDWDQHVEELTQPRGNDNRLKSSMLLLILAAAWFAFSLLGMA